jgi:hypothetical protein
VRWGADYQSTTIYARVCPDDVAQKVAEVLNGLGNRSTRWISLLKRPVLVEPASFCRSSPGEEFLGISRRGDQVAAGYKHWL